MCEPFVDGSLLISGRILKKKLPLYIVYVLNLDGASSNVHVHRPA